ncbi:MAG: MFS transporter [Solirubrobacterales bacterium]
MTETVAPEPATRTGLVSGARISHPTSFAAIAAIFVLFTAASAVPTPLYIVYQEAWGFSAATLTFVFGIYVVGLLGSLLVLGALSDHIGRRPVLGAAIAIETVALLFFLFAGDITVLAIARFLQGIATGAAMTTMGAALVDLNPPHAPNRAGVVNGVAPLGGLAIGALGCGALIQYAPAPTHLVFALLLVGMVFAALIVAFMPETSTLRPGARRSLLPKVGIPRDLRPQVYALIPILAASWALGGLYLSLGPSVAATVFGVDSHLVGGMVVTLLCGTGGVTAFVMRNRTTDQALSVAGYLLAAGMVVTLAGIGLDLAVVSALGTVVAGIGFGASALGAFGTLARIASPDQRGELFAVAFVISYVTFSVPAVIAGFASGTSFGLRATTIVYGIVVALLSVAALLAQRRIVARRETSGL